MDGIIVCEHALLLALLGILVVLVHVLAVNRLATLKYVSELFNESDNVYRYFVFESDEVTHKLYQSCCLKIEIPTTQIKCKSSENLVILLLIRVQL